MIPSEDHVIRAAQARALLEDPILVEVFDRVRDDLVEELETTKPESLPADISRDVHVKLFLLKELRVQLYQVVAANEETKQ